MKYTIRLRLKWILAVFLAIVLVSTTVLPAIRVHAANININVDGSQKFQTMDGFGVNANSASWNNGELRPVIDKLADEGGSTIWRVVVDDEDWEATNDDNDPNNFNWAYYNTVYTNPKFEELWSTISYLNQKGGKVILCPMGKAPAWMGGLTLTTTTSIEDEYAEMITSMAYYGHITRGLQFTLEPNNEPDIQYEGVRMDNNVYALVMNKIAQKLDANGMSDLRMMGSSAGVSFYNVTSYSPSMWQYPTLMAHIDNYSLHDYNGTTSGADANFKSSPYPNKHFYMTEFAQFIDGFAELGEGPTGLLVWDGYDSVYNHPLDHGGPNTAPNDASNDGPALLAYNSASNTYTPRKEFYQFEQLFKYVPAGSVRIGASSSNSSVGTYAFLDSASSRFTLVGNNTNTSALTLSISLNNVATPPNTLSYYQTNSSDNMAQGANVTVSGGIATVTVPANTIFTLTGTGITDTQPPTPPTNLAGNASSPTQADLTWNASSDNSGVAGYIVKRNGVTVAQPSTISYSDTGLSANTTYTYVVEAKDAAGNISADSNTVSVTTPVAPPDTTAPTVSISSPANGATVSGTVAVNANASDDVGVVGTQFKLDGANLGSEDTSSPYSVNWDTTTATAGTHTLTAVARDAAGNSTTSINVSVTVNNTTGALLLGNQTVQSMSDSNSSGSAEAFKYTAIATGAAGSLKFYVNSGSAATSLKVGVYSNNNNHPGTLLSSGAISSPVAGTWNTISLNPNTQLTNGTIYWIGFLGTGGTLNYKDASSGNCSESASSSNLTALPTTWTSGASWASCTLSSYVLSASGPDTTPPSVPTNLAATSPTTSSISVNWTASTDNVGVSGYGIYNGGQLPIASTTSTTYTLTGLSCGTGYTVGVDAYDAAGNRSSQTTINASTSACPDTTPPTAPTNLTANAISANQVDLGWSASTDNVGVTGYIVKRDGVTIAQPTTNSFSDTTTAANTTYTYTVYAVDAASNQSAVSNSANVTTPQPPPDTQAPTTPGSLVSTNTTTTTTTLGWTASTDNVGVTGYQILRDGVEIATTTATGYTDSGLQSGTTYSYSVKAYDGAGNYSAGAGPVSVTTLTPDTTAPTISLTAPAAGATVSGANVTVSANASDNVGVVGVQFKLDGVNLGTEDTSSPYSTTWNTTTTTNGSHTLTAVARDAAGNSTTSLSITVTVSNLVSSIATDVNVSSHPTTKSATIISPAFNTSSANELLVAFISSDGSSAAQSIKSVTGGNLIWTLAKRSNTQKGTAEIWVANATTLLSNAKVTATLNSGSYIGSITVVSFTNAKTGGATASASAASGAPSVNLTTTQAGSWVWAVGNDWDNAVSRVVPLGQTLVDQYLANIGDTFWVQRTNSISASAGQVITINDTGPTTDRWNFAAIEILPQ